MGTGSWGTAFSVVLADAGCDVTLWGRRAELCEAITARHENPDYLPGIPLPPTVRATTDAVEAVHGSDFVVMAVPSQKLRENLTAWARHIPTSAVLVSLMKGVELGTTKRMSEVVIDVTGAEPDRVAVVTGPNLAKEIAARQPAASVVAALDESVAARLQAAAMTAYFRPYTNTDVVGCELGGAVKNVIALAVGMAEGMGFGDNTKASIITRGLAEIARLGVALGADVATFAGLAGLGDLVATCASPLSRNRSFGVELGRGATIDELVTSTRQVAEGVKSCASVLQLAERYGVDMPITDRVAAVVHEGLSPHDMVSELMTRSAKAERLGV
ncbi:MAG: NAD(P)-dependent glycerol-3-phosphate dehydrogenase [Actinomycetota bacterium]|nr:NAD(P)-dependent glycerol-3-phosphate dehydrogenase [Actinomycetota bacterium]